MKTVLLALVFAAVALGGEYTYDEGVVVLTDDNFDQALSEFDFALIEFYAPWCGHCKKLAPEYASAAQELAKIDPKVKLAKVDATVEKKVAGRFGIRGYPSLKFFIKGGNGPIDYEGGRTAPEIVSWLKKKTGPPSVEIKNIEDAEKIISDNEVVGFFFGSGSSDSYTTFTGTAATFDDVTFAHTSNADVSAKYGVQGETLVLFKKFDEGKNVFTGPWTTQAIKDFLNANRRPTVIPFDQKAAGIIFGGNLDALFLIRADNEVGAKAEEVFRSVAKELKGKITFSLAKIEEPMGTRLADYIGVSKESLPTLRIVRTGKGNQKFVFENDITADNIKTFIDDFSAGKLKPFFKSEPIPEKSHEDNVRIVVGKNFKEIVLDENNDVLMEYYAPWCGHCKSLAPIYSSLATRLKDVKGLVIGKMDATANEVDGLSIQGFPTLKFYPKGSKNSPKDYTGERTEEGFIAYLKQHSSASIPSEKVTLEDL